MIVWVTWAFFAKQTQQREQVSTRLFYSIFVVVGFFLLFTGDRPWQSHALLQRVIPPSAGLAWTGAGLTAAGLLFSVWARLHLGRNWSGVVTVKVGHELIRTGPYRFVRHPIYSGLLLGMLGTALSRRDISGFLGTVIVWVGFTLKSRVEEGFMTQTFGAAYDDYRRQTGAILPRFL